MFFRLSPRAYLIRKFPIIGAAFSSTAAIPSPGKYDELINAAGRKRDFVAVRDLLNESLSNGFHITRNTFKFIATNLPALDDLLQILAEIDGWFPRKYARDSLVAELCRMKLTSEALRVVENTSRKIGVTVNTFHPIIIAATKMREMSTAWRVVDIIREKNLKPDLVSFDHILMAYCCTGDLDSAAETLTKMEEEGIIGKSDTYDALVLGSCRAGKVAAAIAVFRRALEDGVKPLSSTYTHIINELIDCGHYQLAVEFVNLFTGRDKTMDNTLLGTLRKLRRKR